MASPLLWHDSQLASVSEREKWAINNSFTIYFLLIIFLFAYQNNFVHSKNWIYTKQFEQINKTQHGLIWKHFTGHQ